jgi:prophage regulatory protein
MKKQKAAACTKAAASFGFNRASEREFMIQGIPETGFVRLNQVLTVIPVGKSSWWAGVKSGKYPKSIKLSIRCTVWRAEDIHDLIKRLGEQPSLKLDQPPVVGVDLVGLH